MRQRRPGGFKRSPARRSDSYQTQPILPRTLKAIGWYLWPRRLPAGTPPTLSMSESDLLSEMRDSKRFLRGMGIFNAAFFDWRAMNRQYIRYLEQYGQEPIGIYVFNLLVASSIAALSAFTGVYAVAIEGGPATNIQWYERVVELDSLLLIAAFTIVGSVMALASSPRVMAARQWARVHCLAIIVSVEWELCVLCAGTAELPWLRPSPTDPECVECGGEGRIPGDDDDTDGIEEDADTDGDDDEDDGDGDGDNRDGAGAKCPKCEGRGSIPPPRPCHACDRGYIPDIERGHIGVAVLPVNKLAIEINRSQHFTSGEGATVILAPRGVDLRSIQDPSQIYTPEFRSIHGGFLGGNSKEMHEREKFQDETGRLSPVQRLKARQRRWRNGVSWVLGLAFAVVGMLLIMSQPPPPPEAVPPPAATPEAVGQIIQWLAMGGK